MTGFFFVKTLWRNFGAAIDMFSNAVVMCPDDLWLKKDKFFYLTYHTVIFLDYYMTNPVKNFEPLLPYTLINTTDIPPEAIDDVFPEKHYSKQEILNYTFKIREKCKKLIQTSTGEAFAKRWINDEEIKLHGLCATIVEHYSLLEIIFYNLRHIQHHTAQLNFILRKEINIAPDWISLVD